MLVESWVKVENILLYENHFNIPICLFTIGSIKAAYSVTMNIFRKILFSF